jgi:hypothetical protein
VIHHARWGQSRRVTRKAFTYRFEIMAEGSPPAVFNVHTASEALRLARLYADTGSTVHVRDRSRRNGYLTEMELAYMAFEETHG